MTCAFKINFFRILIFYDLCCIFGIYIISNNKWNYNDIYIKFMSLKVIY